LISRLAEEKHGTNFGEKDTRHQKKNAKLVQEYRSRNLEKEPARTTGPRVSTTSCP